MRPGIKRVSLILAITISACVGQVQATETANELVQKGHKLYLNGQGERSKFFTTVYIAALYVSQTSSDARQILNADAPQLMRLQITSSLITPERLNSSIKEGLRLSAGDQYERYAGMLDQALTENSLSVDHGDQFDFLYIPGECTYFSRNGKQLGCMPSFEFKQVLFGIWLGERPIQSDLKNDLLKPQRQANTQ